MERWLPAVGYEGVSNVRVGKYIELERYDGEAAGEAVDEMCHKLLANPIIEDFEFELVPE
mgnify:CR=1 FL=1